MPLLSNGRAKAVKVPFACVQPRCSQAVQAYPVPVPECPLHGPTMKEVRHGR